MFKHLFARKSHRPVTRRRPQLEVVEGRMLLSGLIGHHLDAAVVTQAIQGNHIGNQAVETPDQVAGAHIPSGMATPDIVGSHIPSGPATPDHIVGSHIGT